MTTGAQQVGAAQPAADRVAKLVAPSLETMGYRLIRVRLAGKSRPTLQIMVERSAGDDVNVEECAEISRHVSALLDIEDPIQGEYVLEVSSAGIDRPLVRREDFERFAGREARVETIRPLDGRRRFRGALLLPVEDRVHMMVDGDELAIAFDDIATAQLVLTDASVAESLKRPDRRRKHGER